MLAMGSQRAGSRGSLAQQLRRRNKADAIVFFNSACLMDRAPGFQTVDSDLLARLCLYINSRSREFVLNPRFRYDEVMTMKSSVFVFQEIERNSDSNYPGHRI